MVRQSKITAAGNTLVPAYLALREKRYQVRREQPARDQPETWHAESGRHQFTAEDTLSLLGLVAMWEARGEKRQADDAEIEDFLKRFP